MENKSSAPKEEDVFNFIVFVYQKLARPFEDYFKGEFTSLQLNALCILCTDGPMTMSDLAASLHVPPQQLSRMMDKLYEQGHVLRSHDPLDRRRIFISVSESTAKEIRLGRDKFAASVSMAIRKSNDYEEFKNAVRVVNRVLTGIAHQ